MAIQQAKLVREFAYNGIALPDPQPTASLETVREIYSAAYPELLTASIEGPETRGDKIIYTFRKGVGTKG